MTVFAVSASFTLNETLVAVDACTVALQRFVSMHTQICTLYTLQIHVGRPPLRACGDLYIQSLSLRNVSSTDGSGSTMSGSLSMLRPSRLRGSMRSSSSSGKPPSESKHSGTVERALLMSLDRLGLESSGGEEQMIVGGTLSPATVNKPPPNSSDTLPLLWLWPWNFCHN